MKKRTSRAKEHATDPSQTTTTTRGGQSTRTIDNFFVGDSIPTYNILYHSSFFFFSVADHYTTVHYFSPQPASRSPAPPHHVVIPRPGQVSNEASKYVSSNMKIPLTVSSSELILGYLYIGEVTVAPCTTYVANFHSNPKTIEANHHHHHPHKYTSPHSLDCVYNSCDKEEFRMIRKREIKAFP